MKFTRMQNLNIALFRNFRQRAFAVSLAITLTLSSWILYDLYRISRAQAIKPSISFKRVMQKLDNSDKTRRLALLNRDIESYQQALKLTNDPDTWLCLGQLYLKQYQFSPQKDPISLGKAITALKNAKRKMPARGEIYFYLSLAYRQQNQDKKCAQAMARAQMLIPHRIDLARDMATYWANVITKFSQHSLPLLADRFYFLNLLDFRHYGKSTLLIWTRCTSISPWGMILPKQDNYALRAARFYLNYSEFSRARQFLEYVKGKKNISEKYMLLGHTYLQSLYPQRAIFYYEKSLQNADNKDIIMEIISTLLRENSLEQTISLLATADVDNVKNRIILAKLAMRQGNYRRIFGYLQELEKLANNNAELDFLLAKCSKKLGEIAKSISYAEKAAKLTPTSQRYVTSYFRLLLSQDMEGTAALHMQIYGRYLPRPAMLYSMLAQGYLRKNRLQLASDNAKKAVKLEPDNQILRRNLDEIYSKIAGDVK